LDDKKVLTEALEQVEEWNAREVTSTPSGEERAY